MPKKYPAQRIKVFAVYNKFFFMGGPARSFKIAFPKMKDAEKWVEDQCKDSLYKKEDFIIEEMSAIMNAWQS